MIHGNEKNLVQICVKCGNDSDKWSRRQTRKKERRAVEVEIERMRLDNEMRDEDLPEREKLWGASHYSSRPLRRWLESQVGRKWDDVWSDLCQRHDRRKWANWKLIEHVKQGVKTQPTSWQRGHWWALVVDENGILCREVDFERIPWPHYGNNRIGYTETKEWLQDRKVGKFEGEFYWLDKDWSKWGRQRYTHRSSHSNRYVFTSWRKGPGYKLGQKLTEEEVDFLMSLTGNDYRCVVMNAKRYADNSVE